MATATCQLSEDQFLCSICLDVFNNPVSTPCGHSFCKNCIDRHWADARIYKCPFCNQVFHPRPELKVNIFISEMAAHFRESQHKPRDNTVQPAAEAGEVPCDLCPEPRRKALKSCLACLASYCDTHLEPHLNMPALKRHQLIEPKDTLAERVCLEHNKPLELFCKTDQQCVCVICMYSDHKNHEVVPPMVAFEQEKQQLEMTKGGIQKKIRTRELKILELRRSLEVSNREADREITDGVDVFTALKESLEKGLDKLIQEITRKRTAAENQTKALITELEQEICDLKKGITKTEKLIQSEDHLHLLQNISQLSTAPQTKDWTNVSISPPSFKGTVVRALSEVEQDFNNITKSLNEEELIRVEIFKQYVYLDSDTAHPQLTVCNYDKEVSHSYEKSSVPNSRKRFDGLYVLGKQSFSERFYFKTEVEGKTEWIIGVAKESVNRKGTIQINPQNGFWAIGLRNGIFYASAQPKVRIMTKCSLETVGVFVDYDEGIVSFYDVKAQALIYSFTGFSFEGKLYPFFSPGRNNSENTAPLVMHRVAVVVFEDIADTKVVTKIKPDQKIKIKPAKNCPVS